MSRSGSWMLALALVLMAGRAHACSIKGKVWPTEAELADSSALVFVVRIDADHGIDPLLLAMLRNQTPSEPDLAEMQMPRPVQGTVLRMLKGQLPADIRLEGASNNCDGPHLEVGKRYLVFADSQTGQRGTFIARVGSFPLNDTSYSNASLQQVEARLSQEDHTTP